ncbi:MAG: YdeI/OmpD-associated family protein [Bacteroidota bacterium]
MTPIFFANQLGFRNWLVKNHKKETELLVGFYKKDSGKQNMTWSESVDQALCFGWIDGVRRTIDADGYCIRFTPRKPNSNWSAINIAKVKELTRQGLMQPTGSEAFQHRKAEKSEVYSFEANSKKLAPKFEKKFKASKLAWNFFINQAPSYQKIITHWIMSGKLEETQVRRLEKTIRESEKQKRLV